MPAVRMQPVPASAFAPPQKKASRITMPVHLTASASVQSKGVQGVNEKALVNLFGHPMEILEIRFQILPATANQYITGAIASCMLSLGDEIVTNGFVPIFSFCKSYNMVDESGQNALVANVGTNVCNFNWKLPRPLWLAPGELLRPRVQHNGLGIIGNMTVRISYAGRVILSGEPRPKKRCIPWACCYTSKPFDGMGAADSDTSTEDILTNPFKVPLNVQRFVHRANVYQNSTGTNLELDNGYADFDDNLFQVRMIAADGSPVVPVFSTINTVFNKFTRSWECEHMLDPGGYYLAYLNKLAPGQIAAGTYTVTEYISMLGYREVSL